MKYLSIEPVERLPVKDGGNRYSPADWERRGIFLHEDVVFFVTKSDVTLWHYSGSSLLDVPPMADSIPSKLFLQAIAAVTNAAAAPLIFKP